MKAFLLLFIIFSSIVIDLILYVRQIRFKKMPDRPSAMPIWIFFCGAILVAVEYAAGDETLSRLPYAVSLSLLSLQVYTSSLWKKIYSRRFIISILSVQIVMVVYRLLFMAGAVNEVSLMSTGNLMAVLLLFLAMMYLVPVCLRLYDIHALMKSGTVYHNVGMAVDFFYASAAFMIIAVYAFMLSVYPDSLISPFVAVLLLWTENLALGIRIAEDSFFVIFRGHERRIIESLRISHVEMAHEVIDETENYRDIYDRVVAYFEKEEPYLNGNLTINDVVHAVYTNKLYISRAISHYTGRNFCQFVNYYRISHAVRMFRENPELKIVELAGACGFNSVVSFNMAFRLFMNESPSDWCRKERSSKVRRKYKLWSRLMKY